MPVSLTQPPVPVQPQPPAPVDWRINLWVFCICSGMLLFLAQTNALLPILPLYLTQRWGVDAPVGWVVSMFAVGVLFSRSLVGNVLDRWGRKPMLVVGVTLALLAQPLYVLAADPWQLIPVRVLHGLGLACFATTSHTLIADLSPPHRRVKYLGYMGVATTLGFALGPWLSSQWFRASGFNTSIGNLTLLLVLAGVLIAPVPWTKPDPVQTTSRDTEASPRQSISVGQRLVQFPIREATFFFFISSTLHGIVLTFLPLWAENADRFYVLYALGAVAMRVGLGIVGNRLPFGLSAGLALSCSGSAVIGIALWPQWLTLWSCLYGLGFGLLYPVLATIVSLSTPIEQRGRVTGWFLTAFDTGLAVGGAGLGSLIPLVTLAPLFVAWGGFTIGNGLLAWRLLSPFRAPVATPPAQASIPGQGSVPAALGWGDFASKTGFIPTSKSGSKTGV